MTARAAAKRIRDQNARASFLHNEDRINALAAEVLAGPRGGEFLGWLRSITIEAVSDETVTPERLMFREGARWLCAEIERRRALGIMARMGSTKE